MQVAVRFYGIIGDLAKQKDASVELPPGATVATLLDRLTTENASFGGIAKQVRAVVDGVNATRETPLAPGAEVVLMRAIGGGAGGGLVRHADLPIIPSPSGLPSQHIITGSAGATTLFVGQQWLQPGDRVLRHTHPVEEALTFLRGRGEATLGDDVVPFEAGSSLFIPAGIVHGFRNAGDDELHVLIVFPCPYFAETTLIE